MSAGPLLDRLDKVKEIAPGKWLACCPAHVDKTPSLSVRELDGHVLIHCFAGCGATEVLDALGLEWGSLFPEDGPQPSRSRSSNAFSPRELLKIVDHELLTAVIILSDILAARKANEEQVQRLTQVVAKVGKARDMAERNI